MRSFLSLLITMVAFILVSLHSPAVAQQKPEATGPTRVEVPSIPPRPEDVTTLDGIIKAFYETISGAAGQPRQWARDRTLYISDVRFVSAGERDGKPVVRVMDHQEYVDGANDDFVRGGFFEREIHRVTTRFGNIAHVFSTYESRRKADGPVIERGVNSLELFYDGKRWWIAAALWESERAGNPIPKELLP